jgi:rubredoxin
MPLTIKCVTCGFEYNSKFQTDEVSFKTSVIENNDEICPECNTQSTYKKEDYYFT